MSMVRALRTLNALENGTLTGSEYESLLASDPTLKGELNIMLSITSLSQRMVDSPTTTAALGSTPAAVDLILSNPTSRAYFARSETAVEQFLSQNLSAGKYIAYLAGMDYTLYSSVDDLFQSLDGVHTIDSSTQATAAVLASPVAIGKKVAFEAGYATITVTGIGQLLSDSAKMAVVAADVSARTALYTSILGVNRAITSSVARTAIEANTAAMTQLYSTDLPFAKYVAYKSGLDYTTWDSVSDVVASLDAQAGIIASTAGLSAVAKAQTTALWSSMAPSPTILNALIANSTALAVMTGDSAALAGFITSTSFSVALSDSTSAATIASNSAIMTAVAANNVALAVLNNSPTGVAAVVASGTALNILAESANARTFIGLSGTALFTSISGTSAGVAKFMAGHAGLTPSTYNNLLDIYNITNSATFDTLTASTDAVTFALQSVWIQTYGYGLTRDTSSVAAAMTEMTGVPYASTAANDANLKFLVLAVSTKLSQAYALTSSAGATTTQVVNLTSFAPGYVDGDTTVQDWSVVYNDFVLPNIASAKKVAKVQGIVSSKSASTTGHLRVIGIAVAP